MTTTRLDPKGGHDHAAKEKPQGGAAGLSSLTKDQKLAGLILMLSTENAVHILSHLEEEELEAVTAEMANLTTLSQELQAEILREFSPVALQAATGIPGGPERAHQLLEKSVGRFRASDLVCRFSTSRAPVAAMQQIVDMDARHIFNLLRHEKVQTVALVTSYLSAEKASQLLSLMSPETREQVIERLATLAPTSVEVVESVAEVLYRNYGNNRTEALNPTGGLKVAAQVLNTMPRNSSKALLASLKERNPELEDAIRKKMFTFDELDRLDPMTIQKILQVVDTHTLTIALKTASERLKATLLSCISKRAAENIREEINYMGPLKLSEIEAAQTEIIETTKRLEAEGEIDLEAARQKARH